ncbi:hypothetical protein LTS18_007675, partial [Coniosporium uncinatum]
MGLGVLEDSRLQHVPGTEIAHDSSSHGHDEGVYVDPNLKYDRSGPIPIILHPQPTDDPNDPLNWPLWRRDLILLLLSLLSILASTLSPLLAANTLVLSLLFRRTFTSMALLTGYHLLGVGIGGFLFVPSSRIWGKRHTFILGNILVVVSCIWAAATGINYTSLLWARVLQGVGLAPFEALVNAAVADLYCVHQRGTRMAVSNFAVFGGAFFTPVVVGKITAEMGWEWTFWFVAIFAGVLLPFVVLFVPEMAYRRPAEGGTQGREVAYEMKGHTNSGSRGKDLSVSNTGSVPASSNPEPARTSDEEHLKSTPPLSHPHQVPARKSFWQSTAVFSSTRLTDDAFFKLLLRPFPLFLHPGILWACLIQGTLIGWTVLIGIILAA